MLDSGNFTKTNYLKGRFRLHLLEDGNLVLNIAASPSSTEVQYDPFYWSNTLSNKNFIYLIFSLCLIIVPNDNNPRNAGYKAVFNQSGYIYVEIRNGTKVLLPSQNILPESDVYYRVTLGKNGEQWWSTVWSAPGNICKIGGGLGSGACGYNSYCLLTSDLRPRCECPPKFLETLEDINWPTSDYEMLDSFSEEQCRTSCMNDYLCDEVVFAGAKCWNKKLPLSNGRFESGMNGKALTKVRRDNSFELGPYFPRSSGEKKDRSTFILVGSLLLGSSVFFNFMLKNSQDPSVLRSNLRSFTYQELKEATDGFKEVLGRGAFGIVYKGVVEEMGSRNYVAERRSSFKTEASVIGQTHHKNLVKLHGYCEEGQNRLLVYKFMNSSNLGEHLFAISKPNWNQRVQTAFGIARGLMYLHEECSSHIIHCDVKPQNILLDDSFTAKIADFGLAKLTRTGVRRTRGYVAPDWFRNAPITVRVDVNWAYDCYTSGKLKDLVEEDEEAMNDMRRLERLVMIVVWCIQDEPTFRPSMKKVTQMLEGVIKVSVPPSPYPFSTSSGNDTQLL
ncbi:hypothetical protein MKX01_036570 [Papaver californicum]|nr:hypothetical protein MKX01_036570 [Papaver californicum]